METHLTDATKGGAARWIVWSTWAAMTIAALWYVWRFGSDVPFWDEWNFVDPLTKTKPVTLQWLWSVHNGHRLPLPRLVLLALYRISGADFRVGIYFNVIGLAAAAAVLIWASGRMRGGKASVADAFFPLLLLNWGHYENLLWSVQVIQVLPIICVCGLLAIIAAYGFAPIASAAALASVGIITLPLSGVAGLAYAPILAGWLAMVGLVAYRAGRLGNATAIWIAAAVTLILIGLYFHGYTSNTTPVLFANPRAVLGTTAKFATGGLGPVSWKLWPTSGAITAAIILATTALLIWRSVRGGLALDRTKALFLFFASACSLVAAFAIGRTGFGFVNRYFALAAPLWCAAFLAWSLWGRQALAWSVQLFLLFIVCLPMPFTARVGLIFGRDYHRRMEAFRADLLNGASPEELVAHHVANLCPCAWSGFADAGLHQQWGNPLTWESGFPVKDTVSYQEWISANLRKLHDAKIGDYARMRIERPPVREVVPSAENGFAISRAGDGNGADSADTAVLLTPDRPLFVAGVRVRRPAGSDYVPPNEIWGHGDLKGRWVQVFWRLSGESAYMIPNRYVFLWDSGKDEEFVWIFRLVDQIALHVGDRDVQRRLGPGALPLTVLMPGEMPPERAAHMSEVPVIEDAETSQPHLE